MEKKQIKRKPKNSVDVKRDKNKTQSRVRQPAYENAGATFASDEDWY